MFENILEKIKEFDTIIIHCHVRPDGDAIGSQMGLKQFIKDNFKEKQVYTVCEDVPEYLKPYSEIDNINDDIYKESLAIIVDTANQDRISDKRWSTAKFKIKIDHHENGDEFADISYVKEDSPACASILVSILKSWKEYYISKEAAMYLLLGMITDTGRFRYRGCDKEVFENTALLVDTGADLISLYDNLYADDINVLKLQGYVLNNFKTTTNGVVYIYLTKKIMKKYNVNKVEAANLVSTLGSIKNHPIWVMFIDQMLPKDKNAKDKKCLPQNEIRVRIRSRNITINQVASMYRGGGHAQAAASTIYSKKEIKSLLNDLDKVLLEYNKK